MNLLDTMMKHEEMEYQVAEPGKENNLENVPSGLTENDTEGTNLSKVEGTMVGNDGELINEDNEVVDGNVMDKIIN